MIEPAERRISPAESVALHIRKFTNHDYLADSPSIWMGLHLQVTVGVDFGLGVGLAPPFLEGAC